MHDDSSRFRYSTGYVFFMKNFRLTLSTFRVTFTPFDFLRFAWSKILSQSQFQASEFNRRLFSTKSQLKSAPQLVPFFIYFKS